MATILTKIRTKIRALISDVAQTDTEIFSYDSSATVPTVFQLQESNASAITKVLKNAVDITDDATITLDTDTAKVTITLGSGDSWTNGDEVEIVYTYTEYSDSELTEYMRGALVYCSIYAHQDEDYELETNSIVPTPNNRTADLISLISAIMINPDWNQYDLPNLRVRYTNRLPKEQKIEKLCAGFNFKFTGINDVLEFS